MSVKEARSMSLTKPLIKERPLSAMSLTGDSSSSGPMTVKIALPTMKAALAARRKFLVKQRRNFLAAAAKDRKRGKWDSPAEARAQDTLHLIRQIDAKLGLLSKIVNESTTTFVIDIRDPDLRDFGFGMDDNGNYPAL